ncbi:MAG: hypothetical protein OHK0023_04710 [Anaerolineae bacterium]
MQNLSDHPYVMLQPLTIRPARESDREAILEIAARTWEGNDYLPNLLDHWLVDPNGWLLVAADERDQALGLGRLTRLAPSEWWLEGMRVHPDHYGRGIGKLVHTHLVQLVDRLHLEYGESGGQVRLCTDVENTPVHRMCAALGFREVTPFWRYSAEVKPNVYGADRFAKLTAQHIPQVRAFLDRSRHYVLVGESSIESRWLCRRLTNERLAQWVEQEMLYGWYGVRGNGSWLDGVIIGGYGSPYMNRPPSFNIYYADATYGSAAVMLSALRGLPAHLGLTEPITLRYMLPAREELLVAVEQAGWRRPKDDSGKAILFARALGTH